jgi:2-polyprenyl-3-methyl-5-hydroxy-6-metoxy-1,4-benzoquinol methylase
LPPYRSLVKSLAFELGSFLGVTPDEAERQMRRAWEHRVDLAKRMFPSEKSESRVTDYYRKQQHGLALLGYWHSLVPNSYALHSVAGLHAAQEFAEGRRVLDFGCGIGSTAILFTQAGFDVTLADVSEVYLGFASHRFALRNLHSRGRFLNLSTTEPAENAFDVVVAFDVLEHLVDPLGAIARIASWLVPGGLLVMNVAFGRDPDNPEHLLPRRRGFLDRIRQFGFDRICNATLLVFWKRDMRPWERLVYRTYDWIEALGLDVVARHQRLARVLCPRNNPPMARACSGEAGEEEASGLSGPAQ